MNIEVARHVLQTYFGYTDFRESQREAIEALLSGEDCLAIMPTGAGKSICFQVPALLYTGITIVFSPLISLMKDQVDGLLADRIPATYVNSTLDFEEVQARMLAVRQGRIKLLYIAPEKLDSEGFLTYLRTLKIAQVIIDEAHCVSEWGHDFRPAYRLIAPFIQSLEARPIVGAFTATATREVAEDIKHLLGLTKARHIVKGFDRDNLYFSVVHAKDRMCYTVRFVKERISESGIIYCATRKDVERVHKELHKAGVNAGYYHGGLDDATRKREQERYANDEIAVMVATNAFGMGIDKSNVRYVLHYQMPRNMEAYYQEAGRAGRDGLPSECVLLYSGQDVMIHRFLIEQGELVGKREQEELSRLEAMQAYCFTNGCLRSYILRYFGESVSWQKCKNCSHCEETYRKRDRTEEAKIIFYTLALTEMRYGVRMVTDIVRGVSTERILKYHLHRIPTFGRLSTYTEAEIKFFIKQLVASGYVSISEGKYPLLLLENKGRKVLSGIESVAVAQVEIDTKTVKARPKVQAVEGDKKTLFEILRQLRKELARKERIFPYQVFSDTVLIDMVKHRPRTLEALSEIKGVGPVKLQKYGRAFLQVMQSSDT